MQQSGTGFFILSMANTTYSEKLKSPLWQKKRLEILNRDNFTCVLCSDTETELHIHHNEYISGKKPWEYENDNFQTLCKHCHAITEVYKPLGFKAILAVKIPSDDYDFCHITTILVSDNKKLISSIDRCYISTGKIENIDVLEQEKIAELHNLFIHAEKLAK